MVCDMVDLFLDVCFCVYNDVDFCIMKGWVFECELLIGSARHIYIYISSPYK